MFKKNKSIDLFAILIILSITFLDRLTKFLISQNFELGQSYKVIKNFFHITYTRNTGAGFSILEGQMLFFYVITIITFIILAYLYFKEKDIFLKISISLIFAGALGNFYDRIKFNYVIDFLHFIFGNYNFPIFNVADMAITIGGLSLLVYYFFKGNDT